ncbi:MAG: gene transfer agent family protein [Pikeienuella sp.]
MQSTRISWVGGEHEFALPIGNLRALQTSCDAGPQEVYNRITLGTWRVDDLFETVRQGLIGGGMTVSDAGPLVTRLFETHPLKEFEPVASAVLLVSLVGDDEGDDEGKPEGETSPPENGGSQKSTETAQ